MNERIINVSKSPYKGIDFVKFMMALCVVMIHFITLQHFNPGYVVDFIISLAVPFFFIASGFLLANKYAKANDTDVFLVYSKRIWRMYFIWVLIYVPLCILGEIINPSESSFFKFLVVQVRSVFLQGEIRYSYPTWYLFSLGISSSLIYLFKKKNISMWILLFVGVFGILLQYLVPIVDASSTIKNAMHSLSRMTIGVGYLLVGMYVFRCRDSLKYWYSALFLALGILLFAFRLPYFETAGSISLFIIALLIILKIKDSTSVWLRKQSLWIFLTHMYVLTLFTLFLDIEPSWWVFLICIIITITLSQLLILLSKREYGRFLNHLI